MTLRAELDTPDLALSTADAQWEFFRAVNRLAPKVLEELHGEPLLIYSERRPSLKGCNWLGYRALKELTDNPDPDEPDLTAIRESIEVWAAKWNLSAPWVYGCACTTLQTWHNGNSTKEFFPDTVFSTPATSLYSREFFPEQLAAAFEGFMGYEPTNEKASEFKSRFETVCKSFLGEYMADQERTATTRHYPKYPDKRKPELHLEWAVLNQVCELNPEQIAEQYKKPHREKPNEFAEPDVREIRRQIRKLLKLIGLEPRKPKRGG